MGPTSLLAISRRASTISIMASPPSSNSPSSGSRSIAAHSLQVKEKRVREAYEQVARVAVREIEEYRDVMELDYAVKQWRLASVEYERAERDQRQAGLRG